MTGKLKFILPPLVILIGVATAVGMIRSRRAAETRPPGSTAPLVRVVVVEKTDHRFIVRSQGTVEPRTEIPLVAEVSGRVLEVSPKMAAGGFFAQDDVLITVESLDYLAALTRARATSSQAELRLEQEKAQATITQGEWQDLGLGEGTPLALRSLQVQEAEAAVEAARVAVKQAERNLDRTQIRAPFDGRVRQKHVDVGQFVGTGTVLGRIYATDYVEIRLPVPGIDVAFADFPLYRNEDPDSHQPEVTLTAGFGGKEGTWTGQIVRTEGALDPRSRMLFAVARVDDPYVPRGDQPPLAAGLFAQAQVRGHLAENVVLVPRSALRDGNRVLLVTDEDRLRYRGVEVLRIEGEDVVIGHGLETGERVLISPLPAVIEGMHVRVAGGPPVTRGEITEETTP